METRELNQILYELSEYLFPDEGGEHKVAIDSVGYDGDQPIHVLARSGNVSDIFVLISAGANVDSRGEMDETPLHIAVEQQNLELIKVLLAAGAKSNIKNRFGETAKGLAKHIGGKVNALVQ